MFAEIELKNTRNLTIYTALTINFTDSKELVIFAETILYIKNQKYEPLYSYNYISRKGIKR